jgi:hypothetical protein
MRLICSPKDRRRGLYNAPGIFSLPFERGRERMNAKPIDGDARRMHKGVAEFQAMILQRYPGATFQVTRGADPAGT